MCIINICIHIFFLHLKWTVKIKFGSCGLSNTQSILADLAPAPHL